MCALVALTGVGLMAQSRSWGVALAGGIVVTLAVLPGRPRRGAAMLLAAAAVAVIFSPLSRVWHDPSRATGVATAATTRHAAGLILIAAIVAGAVWGIAVLALDRLAPTGSRARTVTGRATGAVLGAAVLAVVVVLAANSGSISHRISTQYKAFVHLAPSPGGTRLFSGAGNRYDYWRVALKEFTAAPIKGVGAGNYQPGYYLHRRTAESITQPHSIELQTLAELGLVGALLLAAFLVAVIVGLVRTAREATYDAWARTVAVAAGGAFTAWWIQTSVDWMHLIPGLTAIALAASVALVARPAALPDHLPVLRARLLPIALTAAVTIAGVITLVPRVVSLQSQTSAEHALGRDAPRDAIRDASTALEYDPSSVSAYELRAAGFARLHDFPNAHADLLSALRTEPENWTTWALLGDLLTRHGNNAAARSAYAHAHALNPLEPGLVPAARARS